MAYLKDGGLDLGTSNTALSYLNKNGELVSYKFADNMEQTPSILFSKNGKTLIGYQARRKFDLGRVAGLYRSYKMHIDIKDEEELKNLGYTEMTPDEVMEKYVATYVESYLNEQGIKQLDTLTLGAPEVFFRSENGTDKRTELKKIVERTKVAKHVRVVSEPAAAAAYYLYKDELVKKAKGEDTANDNCYLLTVDAGGGTLDITLCYHGFKNGKRTIYIVTRSGAGEHFEDTKSYSQCGVYYFEEVLRAAIKRAYPEKTEIAEDIEFKRAYCELEDCVKSPNNEETKNMEVYFKKRKEGRDKVYLKEHADDGISTITYEDDDLLVPFSLMYEVYEETFKKVLERELDKIWEYTKQHGIDVPYMRPSDGEKGDSIFRLISVGGFSAYSLVQYQLERYFKKARVKDPRFGTVDAKEAPLAVAHGLALLANGTVEYSMRAPYGLGVIGAIDDEGREGAFTGVSYGDFLSPGEDEKNPFFVHIGNQKTKTERKAVRALLVGDNLEYMGYDNGSSVGMVKRKVSDKLKKTIKDILSKHISPDGKEPYFNMAFSFDESSQLYIHIIEQDDEWTEKIGPLKFEDIFAREISRIVTVKVI